MKKFKKYLALMSMLTILALVLTGCSSGNPNTPPTSGPYAWIYQWLGIPFQHIMIKVGQMIGGVNGTGWSIVIITLVIRLILLPLMLNQQKKSVVQQEKMARLQPQMQLIQAAMRRKPITQDQQMQLSTWQRELYAKNNVSLTGGIGCLPLLIQFPIMIGIYQAVLYSTTLKQASFFGISLGSKSVVLAIVATVFAVIQSYMSLIGVPAEQKKAMQSMMFMNPIMTLFFSLSFSGALALYWAAGNFMMIIQQAIVTFIITPSEKTRINKELSDTPTEVVVTKEAIDNLFNGKAEKVNNVEKESLHQDLRKRNQGKQNKNHKN
ncbi:membrane protein insertase YidC [Lactobacillus gigeriorum]|uniref:Membrane protein chaperone OxaA n=1 Tax=Lactobacillus gigeriorum DSM 23908 = CRBIP 24.85 TaxID=1423751 RepID=I7LEV7_9LACO|nr:membrane protein insertase YidC [Lactobacillus gigeriorum]KRN14147.1 membrane protein chaperone OxaA [Lactobacillus gigeriorum DSM 23908 = CRBIP 24.85]CCI86118.1 Membrane protein chaperone OxaA [Lactobacillus gigeriorum DSM 23908 = CRBIP 24.85]